MRTSKVFNLIGSICLVLVLAALLLPACAKEAPTPAPTPAPAPPEKVTWVMSLYIAPGGGTTMYIDWMAKEVSERSGGRFTLDTQWGGAISAADETLAVVEAGICDVGFVAAFFYPGELALGSLGFLPFAAPGRLDWLLAATNELYATNAAVRQEIEGFNCVYGGYYPGDFYNLNSKKPIRTAEDLKDVKVKVGADLGRVLVQFGAVPVTISGPESYGALQTGLIDTVSMYLDMVYRYKTYELAKYWTYGMDMSASGAFFLINKDSWDALPADLKEVWESVVRDTPSVGQWALAGAEYSRQEDVLRQAGVEFIEFPASERAKLIAASDSVWDAWIERGGGGARGVLDDYLALGKKYMEKYPDGLPPFKP